MGPDFAASRAFAAKLRDELAQIPSLRDLQFGQTLDYPAIQVNVDRQLAGQLGVTVDQVGRSFAAATSSSRFVAPNYWADPRTGIAFQVQVQVPQPRMTTLEDLRVVPVTSGGAAQAAARRSGAHRERHDRRRVRPRQRAAHGDADGERLRRGPRPRRDAVQSTRSRAPASRRAAPRSTVRGQIAAMERDVHEHHRRARRRRRRHLPAARGQLPVAPAGASSWSRRCRRCSPASSLMLLAHRHDAERAVVHGRDHGDRRRRGERDPARHLRRAGAPARRIAARHRASTPRGRGCGPC